MEKVYNCCVRLKNEKWITYHKVNHLARFVKFLDRQFADQWLWFNVYDNSDKSKSNNILDSFQNGENRKVPAGKHLN